MTKFGGCVNELQVNLLQGPALGLHKQGLKREMSSEYAAAAPPCQPPVHWLLLVTSMANASSVTLTSDFSCYHVQGTLDNKPSTLHLWPPKAKDWSAPSSTSSTLPHSSCVLMVTRILHQRQHSSLKLFQPTAGCTTHLAQCQDPLLGPHNTALHHDEVIGHLTIVDKASLSKERTVSALYQAGQVITSAYRSTPFLGLGHSHIH